jgi:hypothetical protein
LAGVGGRGVPANRIGSTELSLGQLKILQEAIALSVFVPFAVISTRPHARAVMPDFVPRRRQSVRSGAVGAAVRRRPGAMKSR